MGVEEDLAAANAKLKDAEAEAEKWKALSRKHETRASENAAAADELKKLKESSLSDQQRRESADKAVADKLAELEKKAEEADARALRAEVASTKGLTPAQAKRLAGSTREELEADADDILESFKPADTGGGSDTDTSRTTRPATRPKENLRGGGDTTGGNETVETDPAKLAADLPRY